MGKSNGTTRASASSAPRGLTASQQNIVNSNIRAFSQPILGGNGDTDMFGRQRLPESGRFTQREIAPLVRLTSDSEQTTEYGGKTDSVYASYGGYQMQGRRNADGTITPTSAYTTENGSHFDSDLHGKLTEDGFRNYAALYFAEWAREDARRRR